jgi:hypothetical protein
MRRHRPSVKCARGAGGLGPATCSGVSRQKTRRRFPSVASSFSPPASQHRRSHLPQVAIALFILPHNIPYAEGIARWDRTKFESIETRLTALERRATGYRNALVALVLILAAVVLTGAVTTDEVQDVVRTKMLLVVDDAGQALISVAATEGDHGLLTVTSKTGQQLISAGAGDGGNGMFAVRSNTGQELIAAGAAINGGGLMALSNQTAK